jgi:hypothetical protein|uniref:Uncharacterized protein n=1 Tax=viral metagenome TaxID=1070528 RepID=A0A6H1ZBW7_9ZZZZ
MTIKMDADEKAGFAILCQTIPEDLAESIIKARQKRKLIFTPRIAKRLIAQYVEFGNPEQAAEIHVAKGWIDFRCDWAKKESRLTDQNHPTPRPSVNYGNPVAANDPPPAKEAIDPERRAQIVALALRSVRRA